MAGEPRQPSGLFTSTVAGGGLEQKQDLQTASTGRHGRSYEHPEFDEISGESLNRRKKRGVSVEASDLMLDETTHSSIALPSFVGHETAGSTIFGMLFPKRSFPLDASNCTQINTQSWVFDMNIFVGEAYDQVEDICIYLRSESSLPPEKAVACYVQSPGSQFQYRGAVYHGCPSAVLPLMWPKPETTPAVQQSSLLRTTMTTRAQIGISVEDFSSLPVINMGAQRVVEGLALKFWENLFNLVSSCAIDGDRLLVPKRLVDQRFQQFKDRSKKDPEYLKSFLALS